MFQQRQGGLERDCVQSVHQTTLGSHRRLVRCICTCLYRVLVTNASEPGPTQWTVRPLTALLWRSLGAGTCKITQNSQIAGACLGGPALRAAPAMQRHFDPRRLPGAPGNSAILDILVGAPRLLRVEPEPGGGPRVVPPRSEPALRPRRVAPLPPEPAAPARAARRGPEEVREGRPRVPPEAAAQFPMKVLHVASVPNPLMAVSSPRVVHAPQVHHLRHAPRALKMQNPMNPRNPPANSAALTVTTACWPVVFGRQRVHYLGWKLCCRLPPVVERPRVARGAGEATRVEVALHRRGGAERGAAEAGTCDLGILSNFCRFP
eukprot:gene17399-biopygen11526